MSSMDSALADEMPLATGDCWLLEEAGDTTHCFKARIFTGWDAPSKPLLFKHRYEYCEAIISWNALIYMIDCLRQ